MQYFKLRLSILFSTVILLCFSNPAISQWSQDPSKRMEIPDILTLESSESHFYVLSGREGLVVFRALDGSLQWLYSSTGMQERGTVLQSDIRFAYLYGNGRRLTVVEPTSVLGVYSSTLLPSAPNSVSRIGNYLYLAMGRNGLGRLNLSSPESVDSDITPIDPERYTDQPVQSLVSDNTQILYVLSGENRIDIYRVNRNSEGNDDNLPVIHDERVRLDRSAEHLFLTENELIGSDRGGQIFMINSDGRTRVIGDVGSSVNKVGIWNNQLLVHTDDNRLWIGEFGSSNRLTLWKENERAGNYFSITEDQLWISDFNNFAPVIASSNDRQTVNNRERGPLRIAEISDVTLPFPKPLILPLLLENSIDTEVSFSFEAPFNNARIRGNTFYWQPTATQTGRHRVEIFATTADGESHSQSFMIDLRPFNSPPRFTPVRSVTIPVNEAFQLDIKAVDPDGMNQNLIRYLGVDMPEGARLNEQTGLFTWNPTIRQVGTHRFEVVATDQYGAAASQNIEIRVVEISEETGETEIEQ